MMKKVNAKMVADAKRELNKYCKKYGKEGAVQLALENTWLEMEKEYNNRKKAIRLALMDVVGDVITFHDSDEMLSFAAFQCLYSRMWDLIADVVIALEDNDANGLDNAICAAVEEKRLKIGKLLLILR